LLPVSKRLHQNPSTVDGALALPPERLPSRKLRAGSSSLLVKWRRLAGFLMRKRLWRTLLGKDQEGSADVPHALPDIWQ
jgi:hypothetical protein